MTDLNPIVTKARKEVLESINKLDTLGATYAIEDAVYAGYEAALLDMSIAFGEVAQKLNKRTKEKE